MNIFQDRLTQESSEEQKKNILGMIWEIALTHENSQSIKREISKIFKEVNIETFNSKSLIISCLISRIIQETKAFFSHQLCKK